MKNLKLVIGISALLLVCACGKKEKTIEYTNPETGKKSEVSVSKDLLSNEVKIQTEDGKATLNIEQGKMPSEMPDFVKPYPNGKKLSSIHAKDLENKGKSEKAEAVMANFVTSDEPKKVVEFYSDILSKNGFKEKGSMNMGKMSLLSFVNEGQKQAMQIIASNEDGKETKVQIIFEKGE